MKKNNNKARRPNDDEGVSQGAVHQIVASLMGGPTPHVLSAPMMNNHDNPDPVQNLLISQSAPKATQSAVSAAVASASSSERATLTRTMDNRLADTTVNPAVRRYYGTASSPTVPAVLTRGCFFRSWSDAMPLVFPYYYPGNGGVPVVTPPPGFSKPYSAWSPVALDPSIAISSLPTLADSAAFMKAVSSSLSGTYSQTLRLDALAAVRATYPLQSGAGLGWDLGSPSLIAQSDSMSFDPLADGILANSQAPAFSSQDAILVYMHGAALAWDVTTANHKTPWLLPSNSTFGVKSGTFGDDEVLSPLTAALLEFYRQILCSPLIFLRGSTRPGSSDVGAPSYTDYSTSVAGAAKLAQAQNPLGMGGVSVKLGLFLQDHDNDKTLEYPALSFAVNFSVSSLSQTPELIIPRGTNIAGVFHPGFDIASDLLQPIIPRADAHFSWNFNVEILTWGSASAFAWSLGMSNPSSSDLRSLI